jgi:hypothetical protein
LLTQLLLALAFSSRLASRSADLVSVWWVVRVRTAHNWQRHVSMRATPEANDCTLETVEVASLCLFTLTSRERWLLVLDLLPNQHWIWFPCLTFVGPCKQIGSLHREPFIASFVCNPCSVSMKFCIGDSVFFLLDLPCRCRLHSSSSILLDIHMSDHDSFANVQDG